MRHGSCSLWYRSTAVSSAHSDHGYNHAAYTPTRLAHLTPPAHLPTLIMPHPPGFSGSLVGRLLGWVRGWISTSASRRTSLLSRLWGLTTRTTGEEGGGENEQVKDHLRCKLHEEDECIARMVHSDVCAVSTSVSCQRWIQGTEAHSWRLTLAGFAGSIHQVKVV